MEEIISSDIDHATVTVEGTAFATTIEVRSSEIQVTRPYFYKQFFFLEQLVDPHASSAPAWRRP